MKVSRHKLPGRYKGGRRTRRAVDARTRHFLEARHRELDRELSMALAIDDDREQRK